MCNLLFRLDGYGNLGCHRKALIVAQPDVHVVDSADKGLVVLESGDDVTGVIRPRTLAAGLDFQCALLTDDEVIPVAEQNLCLSSSGLQQVRSAVRITDEGVVLVHLLCEDEGANIVAQGLKELLYAGIEHETQTVSVHIVSENGSDEVVRERSGEDTGVARVLCVETGYINGLHLAVVDDTERLYRAERPNPRREPSAL